MLPLLLSLVAASRPALPCAALVHETGLLAESDAQEVVLSRDAEGAIVEYRVHYDGDAADFGWIVTIPAGFRALEEGSDARFDRLRTATQPLVTTWDVGGGDEPGCGCAGAKGDAAGGDRNLADTGLGVDIVAEGFAGDYAYTVVAADDATGLATWLADNGWDAGGTQDSIDAYVTEGGYEFVLVSLSPDAAATPEEGRFLPPVVIKTTSSRLFFPSRMARYAGPAELRTVVYVEGDQGATVSGWTSSDLDWIQAESGQTAEEAYSDALWEVGGDSPTFARVFMDRVDGAWVTRFDTRALATAHTVDAEFALDAGTGTTRHTEVETWADTVDTGAAWLLVPLAGLGLGVAVRRRRG